jgi:hypothetical protein
MSSAVIVCFSIDTGNSLVLNDSSIIAGTEFADSVLVVGSGFGLAALIGRRFLGYPAGIK